MADNVKEEIIVKRKPLFSMIAYVILCIFALVSALIAMMELMTVLSGRLGFMDVVSLLIFGGAAWLMWVGKDFMRLEYEYSFTNGVVDIAQVVNNRKRKELISFRTREVAYVAQLDDPRLREYESTPNVKKIKAVLNGDGAIYFAYFKKEDTNYLVYFEPSREFVQMMRLYNERNVNL